MSRTMPRMVVRQFTLVALSCLMSTVASALDVAWPPVSQTFPGTNAQSLQLLSGQNGVVVAMWADGTPGDHTIYVARSVDSGTTWSVPAPIVEDLPAVDFRLQTDSLGNWVVVWSNNKLFRKRSGDNAQTWSIAAPVFDNGAIAAVGASPAIATDKTGVWILLWDSIDSLGGTLGTDSDILRSISLDNGLTWTAPAAFHADMTSDVAADVAPAISTNALGVWVAMWQSSGGAWGSDSDILVARSLTGGLSWSAPAAVDASATTDAESDREPALLYDSALGWHAAWTHGDSAINTSRSLDAGVTWLLPVGVASGDAASNADALQLVGGGSATRILVTGWDTSATSVFDASTSFSTNSGTTWMDAGRVNPVNRNDEFVRRDQSPQFVHTGANNWLTMWASDTATGAKAANTNIVSSAWRAIPDNATSLVTTIEMTKYSEIVDLNVRLRLAHTYIGDLTIDLTSPQGSTLRLHNRSGGGSDNLVLTYDDEGAHVPDGGALNYFDGETTAGTWTLTIKDEAAIDAGTLMQWALEIDAVSGVFGNVYSPFAGDFASWRIDVYHALTGQYVTSLDSFGSYYEINLEPGRYWMEFEGIVNGGEGCGDEYFVSGDLIEVADGEYTQHDFDFSLFKGCGSGGGTIPDYIVGKVVDDNTGAPVPSATAYLQELNASKPADNDGVFSFVGVPASSTIFAEADGYQPSTPVSAALNGGDNTIRLVPLVTVPDVRGLDQADAAAALVTAGFSVGTVSQTPSATYPEGKVADQNPQPNALAPDGSAVDIAISTGPPQIAVPNVLNDALAAATTEITTANLAVGALNHQHHPTVPVDHVISQFPTAGALVDPGTQINLTVSLGPEPVYKVYLPFYADPGSLLSDAPETRSGQASIVHVQNLSDAAASLQITYVWRVPDSDAIDSLTVNHVLDASGLVRWRPHRDETWELDAGQPIIPNNIEGKNGSITIQSTKPIAGYLLAYDFDYGALAAYELPSETATSLSLPFFSDFGTALKPAGVTPAGVAGFVGIQNLGNSGAAMQVDYRDKDGVSILAASIPAVTVDPYAIASQMGVSWRPFIQDPAEGALTGQRVRGANDGKGALIVSSPNALAGRVQRYELDLGEMAMYTLPPAAGASKLFVPFFNDEEFPKSQRLGRATFLGILNSSASSGNVQVTYKDSTGAERNANELPAYPIAPKAAVSWRPFAKDPSEGAGANVDGSTSKNGAAIIESDVPLVGQVITFEYGLFDVPTGGDPIQRDSIAAYTMPATASQKLAVPYFFDGPNKKVEATGVATFVGIQNVGVASVTLSIEYRDAAGTLQNKNDHPSYVLEPGTSVSWRPFADDDTWEGATTGRLVPSSLVQSGSLVISADGPIVGRVEIFDFDIGAKAAYTLPTAEPDPAN